VDKSRSWVSTDGHLDNYEIQKNGTTIALVILSHHLEILRLWSHYVFGMIHLNV